ncbi:type II toxin-antitoxin system VapC family toxin [Nocardioides sp. Iso805N]|uniref:type II toxin-antitoxin system VapC family toxin n=1 Tax=Nocardioides sp. Iso805N TaxID=1283287 RepID=UPI00037C0D7D|nr:type II toxin-antitoxin system VapC family toxin [Nocardioides sp. Iso805N]
MLVVDTSAMLKALADQDFTARRLRRLFRDEQLAVPEVHDLEMVSAVAGNLRGGNLDPAAAETALAHHAALRLRRHSHRPLLSRIWELRDNLSPYDASYVALAERLDARLITSDARLARAPGVRCPIEVVTD